MNFFKLKIHFNNRYVDLYMIITLCALNGLAIQIILELFEVHTAYIQDHSNCTV